MIKFDCKNCGEKFSVPEIHAGKKGKCPKCKNIILVPQIQDTSPLITQSKTSNQKSAPKDSPHGLTLLDVPKKDKPKDQSTIQEYKKELEEEPKIDQTEPVLKRKLPWLLDIFLYPTNKAGLTMMGIFIGIPLLMEVFVGVLNLVASQFPPFYVVAVFFLIVNLIINIVILFYKYWYLSECVRDSADGQIRAPETIAATPSGEMLSSFLKIFVCIIIFSAPIYYYLSKSKGIDRDFWSLFNFMLLFSLVVVSEVGKSGITFHLLLFFAVFFFPITVLSVIMFDSFRGLNPLLIVRSIFSTFVPYCVLVLLLCVLWTPMILMRRFIVTEVISGRPGLFLYLPGAVKIYLMLVAAHLLGRFYWRYQDKLRWDV